MNHKAKELIDDKRWQQVATVETGESMQVAPKIEKSLNAANSSHSSHSSNSSNSSNATNTAESAAPRIPGNSYITTLEAQANTLARQFTEASLQNLALAKRIEELSSSYRLLKDQLQLANEESQQSRESASP